MYVVENISCVTLLKVITNALHKMENFSQVRFQVMEFYTSGINIIYGKYNHLMHNPLTPSVA